MKSAPSRSSRAALRVLLATGALLAIPLVAMRFTREVTWDGFDFAVAAVLLGGAGLAIELALATLRTRRARLLACAAIVLVLLLVWAELAVGILH
ncbi:hypothetical protein IP92_04136 [Pseudoduganella flava]|uniref:Uncharacterized protein n=1 Tax=Pseudoduganella flava TaxID=871742 RepID=A0A562PKH8_9BURK|nr:hypothetical protein [Pseudoduganella flava]QGZ42399.1 hypothetical protein GO485_27450 [Pseudoduganella flava]TWI44961.1 hypothetical protein IP92_04136 [Pseudoduganella flava]